MTRIIYNAQTDQVTTEELTDAEKSARAADHVEQDKIIYKGLRGLQYPPLADYADAMNWNSKGDSSKLTAYYAACEKVKSDNPKP